MWVTYSAGCSLIVLQNQWNNEVQFCSVKFWHLPAVLLGCPGRSSGTGANTMGRGDSSTPSALPSFPVQTSWAAAISPQVLGIPASSLWGSSKVGTWSSSPSEWQGRGKQKYYYAKGWKSKIISGRRICLPLPVKWKSKAKPKGTGITLQRNRF